MANSGRFVGAEDVHRILAFAQLIEALGHAFAAGCVAPHRHQHLARLQGEADATLLLMPSTSPGADPPYIALKVVTVIPGAAAGLPNVNSKMLLLDGATGDLVVVADGNAVTARRTVATSVLAARYLARPDSATLLIAGAGRIGSLLYDGYAEAFPIAQVLVWDINADLAGALVDRLAAHGIAARLVADLDADLGRADIVTSATRSTAAFLGGRHLRPGTHVDLIGSFKPVMREADDALIARGSIFIDTDNALVESGDLIQPIEAGVITAGDIRGSLADLCAGRKPGRTDASEITVFKTVGSAIADLAAARLVHALSAA